MSKVNAFALQHGQMENSPLASQTNTTDYTDQHFTNVDKKLNS